MEAVANAAGVSVPTVYAIFRSKPRLLSAVVADAGADLDIRRLADSALREMEPRARIAAAAKVIRTIMQRERDLLEVLRDAGTGSPELRDARRQGHRQQRVALERVLRPLHEAGSLRSGVDFDDALASFSVLAAPETYWLLVDELGWSVGRWERWLAESAIRLFVDSG